MKLSDISVSFTPDVPAEQRADIERAVQHIVLTPKGTYPMCRDFGISNELLAMPLLAAQNTVAVEIIDQVQKYEPRIAVCEVTIQAASESDAVNGEFIAKVVCSTNG